MVWAPATEQLEHALLCYISNLPGCPPACNWMESGYRAHPCRHLDPVGPIRGDPFFTAGADSQVSWIPAFLYTHSVGIGHCHVIQRPDDRFYLHAHNAALFSSGSVLSQSRWLCLDRRSDPCAGWNVLIRDGV